MVAEGAVANKVVHLVRVYLERQCVESVVELLQGVDYGDLELALSHVVGAKSAAEEWPGESRPKWSES